MAIKTIPLFGEPPTARRQLSKMYAAAGYRACVEETPRWTPIHLKKAVPCDECFAMQHETKGECGPRADAKQRRSFKGGPILNLCRAHAQLWKDRDERDVAS